MSIDAPPTPAKGGLGLMALAVLGFSIMSVLAKVAGKEATYLEVAFFRGLVSLAILLPLMLRRRVSLVGKRYGMLTLRGVVGVVALLFYFAAINLIPLAEVVFITFSSQALVLPLSALILKEEINRRHGLVLLLAAVGLLLILKPGTAVFQSGALVALGAAAFSAVAYLLVKMLSGSENPLTIVFYFMAADVIICSPALLTWRSGSWVALLSIVGVGVMATLAQICMTEAYRREPASRVVFMNNLGAVLAVVWGVTLFDEVPDLLSILGGLLVVGSCVLIQSLPK